MQIDYPYHIDDKRGRTATADQEKHIRNMIEQVLFTMPGERVNRPDFGSGVIQLVFSSASEELISATELLIQGELQRWLGELIQVESVTAEILESTLNVNIRYRILSTQQEHMDQFQRGI